MSYLRTMLSSSSASFLAASASTTGSGSCREVALVAFPANPFARLYRHCRDKTAAVSGTYRHLRISGPDIDQNVSPSQRNLAATFSDRPLREGDTRPIAADLSPLTLKKNSPIQLHHVSRRLYRRSRRGGLGSSIIVLDQFEEFVILADPERQKAFAALLAELHAKPVKGLKLLLVLRSDYQTAIDELGLSALRQGENWVQVGRFTVAAATRFMARSGLALQPNSLDRVVTSAWRWTTALA